MKPVVYPYDNRTFIAEIGDFDHRAKRQTVMSGGHFILVIKFTACCNATLEFGMIVTGNTGIDHYKRSFPVDASNTVCSRLCMDTHHYLHQQADCKQCCLH